MRKAILLIILASLTCLASAQKLPKVKIVCDLGTIVVEVDTIRAPITGRNFLDHVKKGTYADAAFYRVVRPDNQPNSTVKIEVIQGGLFDDDKIDKIPPIGHETTQQTGILHKDGTISMARYTPGTASTEFFICVGDQPGLDFDGERNPDKQGFAAFGKVSEGMKVVKMIQQQKDAAQYLVEPVLIREISVE